MADTNGNPVTPEQVARFKLDMDLTAGYVPQLPVMGMYSLDSMPMFWLRRDIEQMLWHPTVERALNYFRGGIAGAEFWGGPNPNDPEDEKGMPICQSDERVGTFVKEHCERFWDQGVPRLQRAYEYGWIGAECIYETKELREWKMIEEFSPTDTYLLTQNHKQVGVRVKGVKDNGYVDLWSATGSIPAKGLWYAHRPRYNRFYGVSQLMGAWRPWKRLATKDGAETVIDGAFYRFGYQGPKVRYPDEDLIGPNGVPYQTTDSMGNPRRYARDMAREMGEQYKAGAAIGLPSKRDKDGNYLWDMELPTSALAGITGLLEYAKALEDQITEGIGVPKELLEASETGSGYSGRRIPLEAFLDTQQQIADSLLTLFTEQVLTPLVEWNFGTGTQWKVKVKRLIKTKTKASAQDQGNQAGQQSEQPRQPQAAPIPQQPTQPQAQPAAFSIGPRRSIEDIAKWARKWAA